MPFTKTKLLKNAFFNKLKCLTITVTCKLSLRISELVPVRQDGTMLRESSVRHTTNPAMQFTICYGLFFCYHLFQVPMKWEHSFHTVSSFLVFKYFSKSCLNYTLFQTSFLHSRQKEWGAKGVYNAVSSFCVLVRPGK